LAKVKTIYVCQSCGMDSPKWMGRCSSCGEWNTYQEMRVEQKTKAETKAETWQNDEKKKIRTPLTLDDITIGKTTRIDTTNAEFNRVLGGGVVPGSLILIGGNPGIGKSTLLLQICTQLKELPILYVSGEESEEQIKLRAQRISSGALPKTYIFTEVNISKILREAKKLSPRLIIIDSIQTMSSPHLESAPGTVSQIRECTADLQRFAKELNIPVLIIGHITKEGQLAGPKVLEHIVDVVLQFEGDPNYSYRLLRAQKNRFGSTDEIGIYEMRGNGLREVNNPSELFLSQSEVELSGSAIGVMLEGQRPVLVEAQALVSPAVYGNPQRSATGFDLRRMGMHLAVLEKRVGLALAQHDVFLNIAGGLKIKDPGMDLSILAAIISSLEDTIIDHHTCFAGEVGLSGEIRAVTHIGQRVKEADKLGFNKMFLSSFNLQGLNTSNLNIELIPISKLTDLYDLLF